MKTCILWDLDGTLLDTLEDLLDATNYALRLHGYPERTLGELRRFVGNGAANQIRLSLPAGAEDRLETVASETGACFGGAGADGRADVCEVRGFSAFSGA